MFQYPKQKAHELWQGIKWNALVTLFALIAAFLAANLDLFGWKDKFPLWYGAEVIIYFILIIISALFCISFTTCLCLQSTEATFQLIWILVQNQADQFSGVIWQCIFTTNQRQILNLVLSYWKMSRRSKEIGNQIKG